MNVLLEQLMNESSSIIDLEQRLKEVGKEFSNYRQYEQWLSRTWHKSFPERLNGVLDAKPSAAIFPTRTVKSEGIEYLLHGILHGMPAMLAPGWSMRKNVREYLNATIGSFHHPENGETYLYEKGFEHLFDLLQSKKVDDEAISPVRQNSIPGFNSIGQFLLTIPLVTAGALFFPLLFGAAYLFAKTIRNPKTPFSIRAYLSQRALTDERYQQVFTDFYDSFQLPPPFGLEQRYILDKSSFGSWLSNSMFGLPNLPTRTERSLLAAGKLRSYAHSRRWQKLHYICGTGHVSDIAYFLQHPSYSFDHLEEYRRARE